MNRQEFDTYCGSLKAATHVVQWGDDFGIDQHTIAILNWPYGYKTE